MTSVCEAVYLDNDDLSNVEQFNVVIFSPVSVDVD